MVDKIWYNMEELVGGSEERILIETYWNVKTVIRRITQTKRVILIETYWNVKQFVECKRIPIFNINRNILECKGCSLPAV